MKVIFRMRLGFSIEFFPQECCETCHETTHTHMNCPVCGDNYAGTDAYCDVFDLEVGDILSCQECKAEFQLVVKTDKYSTYCWRKL